MSLQQDLQKLGLTDKESAVFLATLELGQETVQNISKKAKVNRATTYVILDQLRKKGLTSQFDEGKKTFYTASNPEALLSLFELQKKELEEHERYFKAILPQLKSISHSGSKHPVIRFYEGRAGIESAQNDFIVEQSGKKETMRTFFPLDRVSEIFTQSDIQRYKKQRQSQSVSLKVIYNSDKSTLPNTPDGERVKVPANKFQFTSDVAILGDLVRIASLGDDLSAVLIKNKAIAETFKAIFDLAWESAKRQNSNK